MKKLIIATVLFSSIHTFAVTAKPSSVKLDCSKAEGGEVNITSTDQRLTGKEAATLAYKCFVDKNAIQANREKAIQESKASLEGEACGATDEEGLEISTVSSWTSTRPDITIVKGKEVATLGSSQVLLIRENFVCSSVGTSMSEGVTASLVTQVNIEESLKFSLRGKKSLQEINVKILRN